MATLTQRIKAAYAELMPALFLAPGAEAIHKFLSSAIADGDTEMHQLLSEKNESTDDALSEDMDKMKIMQRLTNGQKTTSNIEKTTDITDKREPLISKRAETSTPNKSEEDTASDTSKPRSP